MPRLSGRHGRQHSSSFICFSTVISSIAIIVVIIVIVYYWFSSYYSYDYVPPWVIVFAKHAPVDTRSVTGRPAELRHPARP